MLKLKTFFQFLLLSLIVFSCGSSKQESGKSDDTSAVAEEEPASVESEVVADSINLTIEGNDNMQFNKDNLSVTAGQIVTLTLKHTGQMAKEAMGHNWVLLKNDKDVAVFGAAATSAPKTGYIPEDKKDWTIAYTKVIGGGEQTSVTFTAPPAGYYKFLCSFPGHWGVMQGDFVVKPR